MSPASGFALVFGAIYVIVGLAGFAVTGFDNFTGVTGEALLGFEVNPFHNIVHLGVGATWIIASQLKTPGATEGINLGIGLFYVLAAVLGFGGFLELIAIPMDRVLALDNFLHLITGVLGIAFGLSVGERSARAA